MVAVLLILDGASEPARDRPTSLERARTPALDAVCRAGRVSSLRTLAPGVPAGSESAIPALLGWTPPARVDRGALEAAAAEVEVGAGERAWRVDGEDVARLAAALAGHRVSGLGAGRSLVVGPAPLPPLPDTFTVWPEGCVPPRTLDASTVVIAARGAAAGAARVMGAAVVVPPGATGGPDTNLAGKLAAARAAIGAGAARVVVHVGAPDAAAHALNPAGKVAALERIDAELVGPLHAVVAGAGGTLRVCPDHGCDPATGRHDGAPVPVVDWPGAGGRRLTERLAA